MSASPKASAEAAAAAPASASDDARWLGRAFELARRGLGRVSPNPAVGAVVVRADEAVGEGFHEEFGGPHAEISALGTAGERARGAVLYVTLEPCRHEGKTPPCTNAIAAAGIARVVYGFADPNPDAAGGGGVLLERGIEVVAPDGNANADGALDEAHEFYAYWVKHVRANTPFVTAKWAMTADGRLATRTGDSRWVTDEDSRAAARVLRAESDAVIVGIGTVLRDDPRLTARTGDGREPVRVIVDSALRTPPKSELMLSAGQAPIIACSEFAPPEREEALAQRGAQVMRLPAPGGRVDLGCLVECLHERGKLRLYCEGGATLLGALFDGGRVDEVCVFVAPKLVGGKQAPGAISGRGVTRMKDALDIEGARWERLGTDMVLRGRVGEWDWMDG
jgi:diaminohydroxyphosphoribosylaminopyrimidine deaminase/5-amino-6-(5-phosphoribosylamino)uracil reductase